MGKDSLCRDAPPLKNRLSPPFFFWKGGEGASVERLQSWTKVISGEFSNLHRPNPSSHPIYTEVGCVYPVIVFLYRLGEGELQENFEKDALLYEGTQK